MVQGPKNLAPNPKWQIGNDSRWGRYMPKDKEGLSWMTWTYPPSNRCCTVKPLRRAFRWIPVTPIKLRLYGWNGSPFWSRSMDGAANQGEDIKRFGRLKRGWLLGNTDTNFTTWQEPIGPNLFQILIESAKAIKVRTLHCGIFALATQGWGTLNFKRIWVYRGKGGRCSIKHIKPGSKCPICVKMIQTKRV